MAEPPSAVAASAGALQPASRPGRRDRLWASVMILAALSLLLVRGAGRAMHGAVDYAIVYAQGRAWLAGENPYDHNAIDRVWRAASAPPDLRPIRDYTTAMHSPTILPIAALSAWLPWQLALRSWIVVLVGVYGYASVLLAASVAGRRPLLRAWLISICLCFSPVLAGLSVGQPSILAIGLISLW